MVKYRSKLVRGYGKAGSGFNKKGGQWLNFWFYLSAFISYFFFVGAWTGANTDNPFWFVISLLGLLSLFITPMLFVMVLGTSKFSYGIPNFISIIKAKKIREEKLQKFKDNPLSGYRICSPQFQAYMKKQMEAKEKKKK